MSKPVYWWCVKQGMVLLAYTARKRKKDAVDDFFYGRSLTDNVLAPRTALVRIRVVEEKEKFHAD